jgi:hypothetical protein
MTQRENSGKMVVVRLTKRRPPYEPLPASYHNRKRKSMGKQGKRENIK